MRGASARAVGLRRLAGAPWWSALAVNGTPPGLALEFAAVEGGRYFAGAPKTFTEALTLTRDSVGTFFDAAGILQTAITNVARFDHTPATGARRGLLGEEERTNLALRNEDLTVSPWQQDGGPYTVAKNAGVAPDGNTTASSILFTGASQWMRQNVTITADADHGQSWYVKPVGAARWFVVRMLDSTNTDGIIQWFDTTSVVVGTKRVEGAGVFVSADIEDVGGGWFRIKLVCALKNSRTAARLNIAAVTADNGFTRNTTDTCLYWRPQYEEGLSVTSSILTAASTVTRKKDIISTVDALTGTELVTNGTFHTDLSGWTIQTSGATWINGLLSAPNQGGGGGNFIYQTITTVGGRTYRVTGDIVGSFFCGAFNTPPNGGQLSNSASTRSGTFSYDFVASDTTVTLMFTVNGSDPTTLDNVSAKEVLPHPGYNQTENTTSGKLTLTDVTTEQVLVSYSDSTTDNRIELFVVSGSLKARVIVATVAKAAITLGTVTAGTEFSWALSWIADALRGSVDGATEVADTATNTIPSVSQCDLNSQLGTTSLVGQGWTDNVVQHPTAFAGSTLEGMS